MSDQELQTAKPSAEAKSQRDQELEDLKQVISTPAGMRFFRRFMSEAKVFSTSYTGEELGTVFLEGHRNLGLIFFNDICEAAPSKVAELMVQPKE